MSIYYAVQGVRAGKWVTIFAPFDKAQDALNMKCVLEKRNPACKYRVKWFNKVTPDNPAIEGQP